MAINIECSNDKVSDGYHTFSELYDHRIALFLALLSLMPKDKVWASRCHADGTSIDGWIVAGIHTSAGDVTYHLPDIVVEILAEMQIDLREKAPEWDGHTSADVVARLTEWARSPAV